MDVVTLDPVTFLPKYVLQDFDSLIWTEKYFGEGNFELITYNIAEASTKIPPGTFISLMDSDVVMVVFTNLVEENEQGIRTFKATGKTLDVYLKDRAMYSIVYNEEWPTLKTYTGAEVLCLLAWTYLVNTTQQDPSKPTGTIFNYTSQPNLVVTNSVKKTVPAQVWWFSQGEVFTMFRDIMIHDLLGVRVLRPLKTSEHTMAFDTSDTATRGLPIKTLVQSVTKMRFDIYNGTDRTHLQSAVPEVVFLTETSGVERFSSLTSNEEYKDLALVASAQGVVEVWPNIFPAPSTTVSGFKRRVLFVDGGNITEAFTRNYNNTWQEALIQKGQVELNKRNYVRLFDAEISEIAPYKYKKDYFLGDLVTLKSLYGYQEIMMISEYVRVEDGDGERGYPGLSRYEPHEDVDVE